MSKIKSHYIKWGTNTGEVNSRDLPANYTPTNYTPVQVGSEGSTKVSAHLKGIDTTILPVADLERNLLDLGDSGFPVGGAGPTLSYSPSTRILTVTGTFYFWNQGKKITKTSVTETTTAHANTTGTYYFYYDNAGTLTLSSTVFDLSIHTPVGYVYYNSTLVDGIFFDERHGMMDWRVHQELHTIKGTYQLGSGFTLNGTYSVATGTGGLAANTFGIDSGVIVDEDIKHTVSILNDTDGVGNIYSLLYRTGATSYTWIPYNLPYLDNGTNIEYNQLVTGSYQRTAITANTTYVNYYILATNAYPSNSIHRFIIIPGQATYSTLALAQAEGIGNLDLTGFPIAECVPLWRITYRRENTYNAAGFRARIESTSRIVGLTSASLSAASPTNHNNLTNRTDPNSHPATAISFSSIGNIAATDVQLAIQELDTEKEASLGNPSVSGQVLSSTTGGVRSWVSVPTAPTGDIGETSYSKTVNVDLALTNEEITGFTFSESIVRSFEAQVSVHIDTGSDKWAVYKLTGIQQSASSWEMSAESVGSASGFITFNIASISGSGQIRYSMDADVNRTAINMKFRAFTLSI